MKVLLLGGSGQLGTEILLRWRHDISAPSHEDVDIADARAVASAIDRHNADLVVNCAAFHNVDVCEVEPERAFLYNETAVDQMAQLAQERGIAFVTISTDYVFDGTKNAPYTEDDEPSPLSVYASSKLAGEKRVLARDMKAHVVRTCGVYGTSVSKSKGTFIDRILVQAAAGEEVRVVDDVTVSPTYAGDLAIALEQLVQTDSRGLFHATNTGAVTWYDFAVRALELAEVKWPLQRVSRNDWKAPAKRPPYSALSNARLIALGIKLPTWSEGIAAYLADRRFP